MLLDNKTVLLNNRTMLSDIHIKVLAGQEGTDEQHQSVSMGLCYASNNTDHLLGSSQVSGCES